MDAGALRRHIPRGKKRTAAHRSSRIASFDTAQEAAKIARQCGERLDRLERTKSLPSRVTLLCMVKITPIEESGSNGILAKLGGDDVARAQRMCGTRRNVALDVNAL